jgi:threonine/homoserine/homoserine lactone efflux protein
MESSAMSAVHNLLPFMLFAFVASITPGPTNILVLSNSARYGFKAALPIILGACVAAAGIVLAVGCGLGYSLTPSENVQKAMQWFGIIWLSYMSWQIFCSPVSDESLRVLVNSTQRSRMLGAASLQLVNPKTWMMAIAVASVFASEGSERQSQMMYLSLIFFLISMPCLGAWALLGVGSSRWLRSAKAMRRFNRSMAMLLLASAWMSLRV